jgi:hypothetical protein
MPQCGRRADQSIRVEETGARAWGGGRGVGGKVGWTLTLLRTSTGTPPSIKYSAILICPLRAASCSGV